LLGEDCPLPFTQAVVGAIDEVRIEPFSWHAATIMH
jgi:hypothetical protein